MSFEIRDRDLLARIGRLKTKSGVFETPTLLPVINPVVQPISPSKMREVFNCKALITNGYIIKKHFADNAIHMGIHKLLDFNGILMTDSGAYQILVYGNVEVSPEEVVSYQERIDTDIATILDVPTGWKVSREYAQQTVKETLKRANALSKMKTREDILWVGPVQGGNYLDLVVKSAKEVGKLPFEIHALGSPTPVMEQYLFDILVDMILSAKMNLPRERPLHLFGAGHPFMFALAVALGCDLFDSAAYALYARENRYMTESGTWRLGELEYFPCRCPKCASETPQEVIAKKTVERERFLAEHNLHVCIAELKRIKQAIRDGRLWELVEMRTHAHPALFTALKKLKNHQDFIAEHSPTAKKSGLFFFNSVDLARPQVNHYRKRLQKRYCPPENKRVLLLAPQTRKKPFHKAHEFNRIRQVSKNLGNQLSNQVHVCFYAAPFGVIPLELDEVYPLSQHEIALPLDSETVDYVANQVGEYISQKHYETVVLLHDLQQWGNSVKAQCTKACIDKGITFEVIDVKENGTKNILTRLEMILRKNLSE